MLQPRKTSHKDSNDWPQFDLKQVTITSLKTGQNASLLSASPENPLKVCGKLKPIDDDLIHLSKFADPRLRVISSDGIYAVKEKAYINDYVTLAHVTLYSFAEYDDGTYGFWAAGKAGWFGVQGPASSFRSTYDKMNEAASIFYMLADRWRRSSTPASNLDRKGLKRLVSKIIHAVGRNGF